MPPNDINDLSKSYINLEKKVDKILSYIENDNTTGREGLFKTVAKHERLFEKLELSKAYYRGKNTVYGFIGGLIGGIGLTILDHIPQIIKWFSK